MYPNRHYWKVKPIIIKHKKIKKDNGTDFQIFEIIIKVYCSWIRTIKRDNKNKNLKKLKTILIIKKTTEIWIGPEDRDQKTPLSNLVSVLWKVKKFAYVNYKIQRKVRDENEVGCVKIKVKLDLVSEKFTELLVGYIN